MTMRRASKVREQAELPAGYQFGDARRQPSVTGRSGATFLFDDETAAARFAERVGVKPGPAWRAPHLNAAERLRPAEDHK